MGIVPPSNETGCAREEFANRKTEKVQPIALDSQKNLLKKHGFTGIINILSRLRVLHKGKTFIELLNRFQ